ncbi:MAG TPA: HepT-like ribonuclease domain-containing protein [Thermoanaerobaculia bacterium]|jgi:uncharacterized protein YutE (UPF0331/DUF86 family)|nr:HepT-like ribonuclease domain-containing protein [Thermoanaerobaculia bacterium]
MVRPDVAAGKLARARGWLADAEGLIAREERRDRDLGAFYLFLAIQECIDLATHWVADAGWPVPDDAGASFDLMADRGVLDRDLAEGMRGAVGLRNRIGHGYAAIDHDRIGRELENGAQTLRMFLAAVADEAGL